MHVEHIRQRLRRYERRTVESKDAQRAAVALILRDQPTGAEFLAIHRSERRGDPWSGHMAFPGGRQHIEDRNLDVTAARETFEEVGIDLGISGEEIGKLDDLHAIGARRRLELVISPYVYSLKCEVTLLPDPREVQAAFWVPLATLRQPGMRGTYRYELDGFVTEHDAFVYQGYVIWGLTYRILNQLLDLVA